MEISWFAFFHQKPTPLRQDNDSTGLREHERLLCLNCAQTKMNFLLKPLSFFSHTCIKYRHMHNYAKLQFALPDTLKILSVFQEILNKILSGKNLPVLWRIQLFLPTALLELLLQKKQICVFFGISAINNIRMLGEQTSVEDAKSLFYWWSSWQNTSLARTTLATKSPCTKTILNILTKAVVMSSKLIWPTGISLYWLRSLAGRPGKKHNERWHFHKQCPQHSKSFAVP